MLTLWNLCLHGPDCSQGLVFWCCRAVLTVNKTIKSPSFLWRRKDRKGKLPVKRYWGDRITMKQWKLLRNLICHSNVGVIYQAKMFATFEYDRSNIPYAYWGDMPAVTLRILLVALLCRKELAQSTVIFLICRNEKIRNIKLLYKQQCHVFYIIMSFLNKKNLNLLISNMNFDLIWLP